jgi:hypothetical protein
MRACTSAAIDCSHLATVSFTHMCRLPCCLQAHMFLMAGQAADIISGVAAIQLDPAPDHTLTTGLPASSGTGDPGPHHNVSTCSGCTALFLGLSSVQQQTPSSTAGGTANGTYPTGTSSAFDSAPHCTDSSALPTKVLLERLHQAYAGSSLAQPYAPRLLPATAPAVPSTPNLTSDELIAKLARSALGRQPVSAQSSAVGPAGARVLAGVSTDAAVQHQDGAAYVGAGTCLQDAIPGRQGDRSYMVRPAWSARPVQSILPTA